METNKLNTTDQKDFWCCDKCFRINSRKERECECGHFMWKCQTCESLNNAFCFLCLVCGKPNRDTEIDFWICLE
jgi:hypothetical protein